MKDILGLILSVIGTLLAVGAAVLAWRKKLLQTGFSDFKESYRSEINEFRHSARIEMDDFKTTVRNYINQNEERHAKTLNRIVELYEQTHREVTTQTGMCRIIQAKREGTTKYEDEWKKQIEQELDEVRNDVKHIREVINHNN